MRIVRFAFASVLAACVASRSTAAQTCGDGPADDKVVIYVGSYSNARGFVQGTGVGITAFEFNAANGALTQVNTAPLGSNPTFITGTTSKTRRVIYTGDEDGAASTVYPGKEGANVYAFAVDGKGKMTELNRVDPGGAGVVHLALSPDEKFLAVSNYGVSYSSVSIIPLTANGSLMMPTDIYEYAQGSNVVPSRQGSAHMHSMNWLGKGSPGIIGADLGNDRLVQYTYNDATGKLTPNAATPFITRKPGDGPRHLSIHPTKKWAYLSNELANTVSVFDVNFAAGTLSNDAVQTISTVPAGFNGTSNAAEVRVSESGKFLYVSNRGHDSIAIYAIGADGQLTSIAFEPTRGRTPRNFDFYKNYMIVANQDSNDLQVFSVNAATGLLTYANQSATVGTPTRVFIPHYE